MNYRRALRVSTDSGLAVFLITILGVVLWTTDQLLNWNLLPDWIDKYAQVLVIVLAILAGFSVVISLMCSFAVMAESAAERAGMVSPAPSRRARRWIALGGVIGFGILFGLHKLDQYRTAVARREEEQTRLIRYARAQTELEGKLRSVIALFSPAIQQHLVGMGTEEGDKALGRLLNAIHSSTPFSPEVSVLVTAETPYKYCIITPMPEQSQDRPDSSPRYLKRQFLTDLPSEWERDLIERMFRNEKVVMGKVNRGVFIDTEKPSAWAAISLEEKVVAVILLRGTG